MVSGVFNFRFFDFDRKIMEIMPIYSSTFGQIGIDGVAPPPSLLYFAVCTPFIFCILNGSIYFVVDHIRSSLCLPSVLALFVPLLVKQELLFILLSNTFRFFSDSEICDGRRLRPHCPIHRLSQFRSAMFL